MGERKKSNTAGTRVKRGSYPYSMSPERKSIMIMFILFLVLLIALALAATRWGFDSRDGIDSPEWGRRAHRAGSSFWMESASKGSYTLFILM